MSQRYAITHVTRFTYDDPVSESVMEVRLRPITSDRQQCLQFSIDVQPRARTFEYQDFLGNTVHHFNVPRRHRELVITTRSHVEVDESAPVPAALPREAWDEVDRWATATTHWEGRQPSQFAQSSDALVAFVDTLGIANREQDPLTAVRTVMSTIFEQFEYAPNTTRVDSPVDEAIAARRGVCQDFSHIMIATLRRIGLPARYVSGYIAPFDSHAAASSRDVLAQGNPLDPQADDDRPAARDTSQASHAWVEVCLPELGWIGFDPTHNIVTGDRHVRVAVGRDYADVPPTRGVFKGKAAGALEVSVSISAGPPLESLQQTAEARDLGPAWSAARPDEPQSQQQQQQQ